MNYSAIVLSGGQSKRFGQNKSLTPVMGKAMILYVIEAVSPLTDEILVVTDKEDNRKELSKMLDSSIHILLDEDKLKSPVVGALTGFKYAKGKYSLLLACDTPLISKNVLSCLLNLTEGYDAVIPKWPNDFIEPLQAAYNTRKAYEASMEAINNQEFRMKNIILRLKKILYISTIALSREDENFHTFFNVNFPQDILEIEKIVKRR
ncbi:MAG: molybdenum cofactor guanylyltransferase [Candidatus Bathyarchaeota archaeon]